MNLGAEIVLAFSSLLAQETQDPVERSVQRAKERLQLSDEQTTKAREIYKKQNDDLRAILTDEQKKRMDEDRGGRGQGGPGAPQGGPRGGSWLPSTDDLKAKLGLTDDQVSKVNEVRDAARQQVRDFFRNRGRGGNPGDEWTAFEAKMREDVSGKIRGLLSDEQKPKFEEAIRAAAAAAPSQDNRFGRGGNNAEDRTARAMEALKITDAKEAEAVKGLVSKVAVLMDKVESLQREVRAKVDEMARDTNLSDEAVGDRVGELLKGVREAEKDLAAARRELTDVVTNRQELELLRRGLLR
jgi:Spy/CpxP family protein refolding chaperone